MSTTQHKETVIYTYGLEEAIHDEVLFKLWPNRWNTITSGKPLVITAAVHADISPAGLMEIWNAYVTWRRAVMPTLPEEEQMFTMEMNGEKVWVIEDGQVFTILYPSDY